jgi:hypothetical protein
MQKKYKTLVQDFIIYLKNFESDLIESSCLFSQNLTKKKGKTTHDYLVKRKTNIKIESNEILLSEKIKKDDSNFKSIEKPLDVNKPKQSPEIIKIDKQITPSTTSENKIIKKETIAAVSEDNFNDIKNIIKKISKNLNITNTTLDDKIAKQNAEKYKFKNIAAKLIILVYKENEKFYKFLEKLSIALNNYFYPSKVISAYIIEKENNWDIFFENEISLIISSDQTIFDLPNLKKYYKENPVKKEKYLNNIPLFLLSDISIYLKEPLLKASLFEALKQKIQTPQNEK